MSCPELGLTVPAKAGCALNSGAESVIDDAVGGGVADSGTWLGKLVWRGLWPGVATGLPLGDAVGYPFGCMLGDGVMSSVEPDV